MRTGPVPYARALEALESLYRSEIASGKKLPEDLQSVYISNPEDLVWEWARFLSLEWNLADDGDRNTAPRMISERLIDKIGKETPDSDYAIRLNYTPSMVATFKEYSRKALALAGKIEKERKNGTRRFTLSDLPKTNKLRLATEKLQAKADGERGRIVAGQFAFQGSGAPVDSDWEQLANAVLKDAMLDGEARKTYDIKERYLRASHDGIPSSGGFMYQYVPWSDSARWKQFLKVYDQLGESRELMFVNTPVELTLEGRRMQGELCVAANPETGRYLAWFSDHGWRLNKSDFL